MISLGLKIGHYLQFRKNTEISVFSFGQLLVGVSIIQKNHFSSLISIRIYSKNIELVQLTKAIYILFSKMRITRVAVVGGL